MLLTILLIGLIMMAHTTPLLHNSTLPHLCDQWTDSSLHCRPAKGDFRAPSSLQAMNASNFTVVSYNIDKNGQGGDSSKEQGLQPIIDLFLNGPLQNADMILLQEVARDCGEGIDGAESIAMALNMSYVYHVEYLYKNNTPEQTNQCTNGNAILSRHYAPQVDYHKYEQQCCLESCRYGYRGVQVTQLKIGSLTLQIMNTHLESGQDDFFSILQGYRTRVKQAAEVIQIAAQRKNGYNKMKMSYQVPLEPVPDEWWQNMYGRISSSAHSLVDSMIMKTALTLFAQEHTLEEEQEELPEEQTQEGEGHLVQIIGGDLNAPLYKADLTYSLIRRHSFVDSLSSEKYVDRNTCPFDPLAKVYLWIFDYFFYRSSLDQLQVIASTCASCQGYSDHNPIILTLVL